MRKYVCFIASPTKGFSSLIHGKHVIYILKKYLFKGHMLQLVAFNPVFSPQLPCFPLFLTLCHCPLKRYRNVTILIPISKPNE